MKKSGVTFEEVEDAVAAFGSLRYWYQQFERAKDPEAKAFALRNAKETARRCREKLDAIRKKGGVPWKYSEYYNTHASRASTHIGPVESAWRGKSKRVHQTPMKLRENRVRSSRAVAAVQMQRKGWKPQRQAV